MPNDDDFRIRGDAGYYMGAQKKKPDPPDCDHPEPDGRCPVVRDGCQCTLMDGHTYSYGGPKHCFEAPTPEPDPTPLPPDCGHHYCAVAGMILYGRRQCAFNTPGPLRPAPKPDPDLRALSVAVTDIRALLTESNRLLADMRGDLGEFLTRTGETEAERVKAAQDRISAMEKMVRERLGLPDRPDLEGQSCTFRDDYGRRCCLKAGHAYIPTLGYDHRF